MASAEPDGARQELESLENFKVVYNGDKAKAFVEWAREHAERLYPDVGMRSYVVPPLFVHKHSMRYNPTAGADVLQEAQKSSPKGERAHGLVTRSFSLLSPQLKQPLFVISGLEYDNMLKWVRNHPHLSPALPDDVENRGDIDIMLVHPAHGVIFLQVKAVGDNAESRTEAEVHKRISLGGKQLRKDENILRWVLHSSPETRACHVTRVVALPNLTRQELASFWPPADLDPASEDAKNTKGVIFLCKDDLPAPSDPATPEADTDVTSLMTWWETNVAGIDGKLSTSFIKDLVSRYVGMLSAVEVYTGNNLRKEVRVTSDAVDACSMMFRRILLNEQQLHILSASCRRRYLSGPPGSGKTVILVLRSRQFVKQGGHVIIINMYRGAAGRAIGHFIRDSVARFRVPLPKGKSRSKGRKKKGEERHTADDATPQSNENDNEKQPSSDRPKTASPSTRRRGSAPNKDLSITNKEMATPNKERNTPNKDRNTPKKELNTSADASNTPDKERNTSDKELNTSKNKSHTPNKDRNTPKKESNTPNTESNTPNTESNASTKELHTPTKGLNTSTKELNTPPPQRRRHDTPPSQSAYLDTPPRERKRLNTAPSLFRQADPLPAGRKRLDTAPSHCKPASKKNQKKQGGAGGSPKPDGTPPSSRKDLGGTPPSARKSHGSPTTSRRAMDTEVDMSDRVHSVDVDIDRPSFNKTEFEAQIRHCLPADVKPNDVMFVVDEIYVKEYWSDVLDVLDGGFPGCHIWCAGLYSRNPPGFEQADLLHVLRCPPMVQKVLYAVDWDLGRKTRYRLSTDSAGVYTPGLTPLSVRHQGHPQVSITECTQCAKQLTSLLRHGLSLTPGASRDSGSLLVSDVVVLVNIPRHLYEPDIRGFLDTTRQDFNTYMAYLTTCPLIETLRQEGLPVKVIEELPCWSLYDLEHRQDVVAAWCYAYQGLENKVVVYLPGDTPWVPDPHGREIPAPGLCSEPRDEPKVWEPTTMQKLQAEEQGEGSRKACEVTAPDSGSGAASSPKGEVDSTKREVSSASTSSPRPDPERDFNDQGKLSQAISELTVGEGTKNVNQKPEQGTTSNPEKKELQSSESCGKSTTPFRAENKVYFSPTESGNETRKTCDSDKSSPRSIEPRSELGSSGSGTDSRSRSFEPRSESRSSGAGTDSGSRSFEPGSGSRSSGAETEQRSRSGVELSEFWWREEDVRRYSNWDKSNLFVAGSRCLSQLIMLVP